MSHATSADVIREQRRELKREMGSIGAGVMIDHHAAERQRRADAMAKRYEELMELFGLSPEKPYPTRRGRAARSSSERSAARRCSTPSRSSRGSFRKSERSPYSLGMSKRPRSTETRIVARLNAVAQANRWTNQELADRIGCHQSAVARWRVLRRGPKTLALRAALVAFLEAHEPEKKPDPRKLVRR